MLKEIHLTSHCPGPFFYQASGTALPRPVHHLALNLLRDHRRVQGPPVSCRPLSTHRFVMLSLEFDYMCQYDYVEVRDGDSINSQIIRRFCGNERPAPIRSTGSSLHILFHSDGSKNFDGFHAIFEEITGKDHGDRRSTLWLCSRQNSPCCAPLLLPAQPDSNPQCWVLGSNLHTEQEERDGKVFRTVHQKLRWLLLMSLYRCWSRGRLGGLSRSQSSWL